VNHLSQPKKEGKMIAHKRDHKMEEAIGLLQDAAKERKDDLAHFFGDEYSHLRHAVEDVTGEGRAVIKKAARTVNKEYKMARKISKSAATKLKRSVKKHPFPFLIGTAVGVYLWSTMKKSAKATTRRTTRYIKASKRKTTKALSRR
jgi:hypothetical protein